MSFNHETSLSLTYSLSPSIPFLASVSLVAPPAAISNTLLPCLSTPPFSLPSNVEAVLDIPLLLENKINDKSYILIFVDAKKKDIDENLKKRKNYNSNLIKRLKKIQTSLKTKKNVSNFIIKNNFRSEEIKKKVKIIKKEIFNL